MTLTPFPIACQCLVNAHPVSEPEKQRWQKSKKKLPCEAESQWGTHQRASSILRIFCRFMYYRALFLEQNSFHLYQISCTCLQEGRLGAAIPPQKEEAGGPLDPHSSSGLPFAYNSALKVHVLGFLSL